MTECKTAIEKITDWMYWVDEDLNDRKVARDLRHEYSPFAFIETELSKEIVAEYDKRVEMKDLDGIRQLNRFMAFVRDPNDGLGYRGLFKTVASKVATSSLNVEAILNHSRWDDLIYIDHHTVNGFASDKIESFVMKRLAADYRANERKECVSDLAKWMPSINASSKTTRDVARTWTRLMDSTESQYRKVISSLRKNLREHLKSIKNAGRIMTPTDVVGKITLHILKNDWNVSGLEETLNAMIADGSNERGIVPVVSCNMKTYTEMVQKEPFEIGGMVATTTVALMLAKRNNDPVFGNTVFMTSSDGCDAVNVGGRVPALGVASLIDHWRCGTLDIESALERIVMIASANGLPKNGIPPLLIMSTSDYGDMVGDIDMKKVFEDHGFDIPPMIVWSMTLNPDGELPLLNDMGYSETYINGFSKVAFDMVTCGGANAVEIMKKMLEDPHWNDADHLLM